MLLAIKDLDTDLKLDVLQSLRTIMNSEINAYSDQEEFQHPAPINKEEWIGTSSYTLDAYKFSEKVSFVERLIARIIKNERKQMSKQA